MREQKATWTPWLANPGTGECPVPEWAEDIRLYTRAFGEANDLGVDQRLRWECIGNGDDFTHYRYVVPAELRWLAEHVTRWGGGDRKYVWLQIKHAGWREMYSDGESSVITQYSKDDWLRARRDLGLCTPADTTLQRGDYVHTTPAERYAGETVPEPDPVNHPDHYQSDSGIECIDAIRAALGRDGFIAYCRGNAIKYAWRAGRKAKATEDKRKAAWYLERAAREDDG